MKEAKALMSEGDSFSSVTLFKWKPDWDSAATKYEKASLLFRNVKAFTESKDALGKAATSYANSNSIYLAGKCCEDAGNIAKDQGANLEAADWFEKAADYYHRSGKSDRASALYVRAASVLTKNEKDRAIKLFKEALDIYSTNDSFHLAADVYRSFNSYLIKEELYLEAISNMEKQIIGYRNLKQDHNIWKSYLSIIIIELKLGEWVKATEYQEKFGEEEANYYSTEESKIAQDLLNAFEKNDDDLLKKTAKLQKIRLLENQVARVAINLKLPGSLFENSKPKTNKKKYVEKDVKRKALFGDDEEANVEVQEEDNNNLKKDSKTTADKKKSLFGDENEMDPFDPNNLS